MFNIFNYELDYPVIQYVPALKKQIFPTLGSNVSYKVRYFSNSRQTFLDSFLKHAIKLKFLQVRNLFEDFMLQTFSFVRYLKGPCSFALYLQLLNAELVFATSV